MKRNLVKLSKLNEFFLGEPFTLLQDRCVVFRSSLRDLQVMTDFSLVNVFRSDFFNIIHILRGTITVKINSKEYHAGEHAVFISTPDHLKAIVAGSDDCEIEGVVFTSNILTDLWLIANLDDAMMFFANQMKPFWQLDKKNSVLLSSLLDKLEYRLANIPLHDYGRELVSLAFSELLFELAPISKAFAGVSNLRYGRKEDLVTKFMRLAQANHLNHRQLSYYANYLHVTSKHLSETVKEVTGKSAGQLLDDLNLMEAKRLLENGEMSIAQVASMLNFSSPAIFTRFFHRMEGLSPRDFRQREKS